MRGRRGCQSADSRVGPLESEYCLSLQLRDPKFKDDVLVSMVMVSHDKAQQPFHTSPSPESDDDMSHHCFVPLYSYKDYYDTFDGMACLECIYPIHNYF